MSRTFLIADLRVAVAFVAQAPRDVAAELVPPGHEVRREDPGQATGTDRYGAPAR